jgi:hypothetical protein
MDVKLDFRNKPLDITRVTNGFLVRFSGGYREAPDTECHVFQTLEALTAFIRDHFDRH